MPKGTAGHGRFLTAISGVKAAKKEGELGWWEMASREPHPRLAGQVLRYCGYQERTPEPFRRRAKLDP